MRARGPRGTRGLVEMVRDQVAVLVDGTGKVAKEMAGVSAEMATASKRMDGVSKRMDEVASQMADLGKSVYALAKRVDIQKEITDEHEDRLTALEKKKP